MPKKKSSAPKKKPAAKKTKKPEFVLPPELDVKALGIIGPNMKRRYELRSKIKAEMLDQGVPVDSISGKELNVLAGLPEDKPVPRWVMGG